MQTMMNFSTPPGLTSTMLKATAQTVQRSGDPRGWRDCQGSKPKANGQKCARM